MTIRAPNRSIALSFVTGAVSITMAVQDAPASLRRRKHVDFALQCVAVRDLDKPRSPALAPELLTTDASAVVANPDVQLVVELTGAPPAFEWVSEALRQGKDVVTANKALLAEQGEEALHDPVGDELGVSPERNGALEELGHFSILG